MLTLKKAWTWLKSHWYVPLFLLLVGASGILGILGLSKNKQLEQMLEINKKSYQDQIEKKKKLDTMAKKYKGTPDELAKELSEMFGVQHVE